jgi:hypothetical protein
VAERAARTNDELLRDVLADAAELAGAAGGAAGGGFFGMFGGGLGARSGMKSGLRWSVPETYEATVPVEGADRGQALAALAEALGAWAPLQDPAPDGAPLRLCVWTGPMNLSPGIVEVDVADGEGGPRAVIRGYAREARLGKRWGTARKSVETVLAVLGRPAPG